MGWLLWLVRVDITLSLLAGVIIAAAALYMSRPKEKGPR
jgi:hypothetical protein